MSKFGKCSKHNTDHEIDWMNCGICSGSGTVINDDYGFEQERVCWQCKGDGEYEVPKCQECDDDYEAEMYEEYIREQKLFSKAETK